MILHSYYDIPVYNDDDNEDDEFELLLNSNKWYKNGKIHRVGFSAATVDGGQVWLKNGTKYYERGVL